MQEPLSTILLDIVKPCDTFLIVTHSNELGDEMATFSENVVLAKEAIKAGVTRGRFIREHSSAKDSKETLQSLSDAYSIAVEGPSHKSSYCM